MRALVTLCCAGLLSIWPAIVSAQSPELQALHARVTHLYATGHNAEAAAVAAQALELAIVEFGRVHPSTASLTVNLARLHGELKQWPRAELYYREAVSVRVETLGTSHPDTGEAYAGLGQSLAALTRFDEAEASYWRALDTLGVEVARNPHVIDELSLRAGLYRALATYYRGHRFVSEKRYGDAELLYLSAIAVFEANGSVDRDLIVEALGKRAAVLRILNRHEEALEVEDYASAAERGRSSCPRALLATC